MNIAVTPATDERRIPALRLLFARFPVDEQQTRLHDALAASERGTLDLTHLLLAEMEGMPVGSALVMLQTDGIALVWPPVVSCGATDSTVVEDVLMREICHTIDHGSARLSQCLLALDDDAETAILSRHGFERATDMFFLARAISSADATDADRNDGLTRIDVEPYRPENAERFARLIESTYQGSLDCTYLNGIRSGSEAIVSHKLSGKFDPARWGLYSVDGVDAGVMLLNDHPDQDAVELVYLGVSPTARGRGLGRRMLRQGLADSALRGQAVIFLAVDCENRFANSLYSEFEFAELARRRVLLRRPPRLARQ